MFPSYHASRVIPPCSLRCDALVPETLVMPLGVIVAQILVDRRRESPFTVHDALPEGLLFDRAHCGMQAAVGCGVIPAISTRRMASAIPKSTYYATKPCYVAPPP